MRAAPHASTPEQLLEEMATVRPPHPCGVQPEAKVLARLGDLLVNAFVGICHIRWASRGVPAGSKRKLNRQ